jgi:TIR domain
VPPPDRPDVFLSYAREDIDFAEHQLTSALVAREKNVWIDVEDIRGGASDWRASVWAGIESATVMVFVLTPDSLASKVCGEELQHAAGLNKRIIPVLRRSVDELPIPDALERPNWVYARPEDDFETSVTLLIDALELDEAWVEQHARLTQRTGEWLRHDRDGSYLLRGSDLRDAESWLDDQAGHREAPTAEQVTYITASRRAAARRQQTLLGGVALALLITAVLAVVAVVQRSRAIDREQTSRAQALAAQ